MRSGAAYEAAPRRRSPLAVAVLTVGSPTMAYGERTIQGIAARLLSAVFDARKGSVSSSGG